ncbi:MAG TPA: L-aspartate oxidase [Nitrospiraceae bacterium]|nr:L-aspartate oxidase [Nitrospiraceae bacterium]
MKHQIKKTDFLVIGGGVAGLRAAIELAPNGRVLVLTKDRPTESSTEYAQGGIAVALSDEDEVGIHYEDTLKAGDGLCKKEAVKVLVEEGPEVIRELISWGAQFDKIGSKLAFTKEAAHSRRRILHAHGDATGRELERVLIAKVKTLPTISRYDFAFTLDLIVEDGRCVGAFVLRGGKLIAIYSKAIVLATGGAGQLYSRTTNPPIATGDGMAIAYRAGAVLKDMEFVQFHPTSLYFPSAPQFLLSEAMRGEGAVLKNIKRERFMHMYHPMAELAPRDIVTRAMVSEMVRTNAKHVYLDLSHLNADFIKSRFPRIYSTCLQYDIDITEDLIPVCPAAHYVMGGVKTDLNGATNIKCLFAAGEVACTGVHGANRLASNSLLEGLVYGARAGRAAADYVNNSGKQKPSCVSYELRPPSKVFDAEKIRNSLRRLMWEKVGIIRCKESLSIAKRRLKEWDFIFNADFLQRRELELKNMLTIAKIITEAALVREGSIGAHFRSDFKERADERHIEWVKGVEGPIPLRSSSNVQVSEIKSAT